MPSSHAQNAAYAWAVHASLARAGLVGVGVGKAGGSRRARLPPWWPRLESAALALAAAAIAWARVYLGYHTWGQVAAGASLGMAVGVGTAAAIRRAVAAGRLGGGGGGGGGSKKKDLSPVRTASSPARRANGGPASPPASPQPRWKR